MSNNIFNATLEQLNTDMDRVNISGYSPNQILAQEKRGSDKFLANGQMPIKPSEDCRNEEETQEYRTQLESLGFVLGKPVDDLFMEVQFPEGWAKDAYSEDPRHITIKDEKGRDRISVFYKAAFYDRCANAHLLRRYRTDSIYYNSQNQICEYNDSDKTWVKATVTDQANNNQVVFTSTVSRFEKGTTEQERKERWKNDDLMKEEANNFLNEKLPDWHNPIAYW